MIEFYQRIEKFVLRIIEKLENKKISISGWLFSFLAIVFLRTFLEALSTGLDYFQFKSDFSFISFIFFHLPAFYLFGTLVFILLLHFLTKERIEKISRVALFVFPIILLPPIIDLIVTGGQGGISTQYVPLLELPSNISVFPKLVLKVLLYGSQGILFFGKLPSYLGAGFFAMNYGIRIQLGFIFLGFIWYVFLKTKNIFKVFLGLIILYFGEAVFFYFPITLYSFSASLNPLFGHQSIIFSLYFFAVCILALLWFYAYNKEKFLSLLRNLRLSRVALSITLLALGLYLGEILNFDLNFGDKVLIFLAIISLFLLLLGETIYDDLSDEKADRVSNPFRPLPANKFTREEFRTLGAIFFTASYLTALAVGYAFFVFLSLRGLIGYLYAFPPFRLKRFPFLATFSRALAFLFTVYAGFLLISVNTVFAFPGKLALFILVTFALGTAVKDIRDCEGDKAAGIYTIPAIFGIEKGKKIIGFLTFFAFLLAPLIFFKYFRILILPALFAGTLSFWLINKEKHTKNIYFCLFLVYLVFGLFFILTIF